MESNELLVDSKNQSQKIETQKETNPAEELAQQFADQLNRMLPEIVNRELAKVLTPSENGQNAADAGI